MTSERAAGIRRLRGLKNISWLSARQLNRLAAALTVTAADKREIIIDEKHSPESAHVLLTGVARITCRNRKGDRVLVIVVAPPMPLFHVSTLARPTVRNASYPVCTDRHRLFHSALSLPDVIFCRPALSK
jgi:signal-transduction protein with cAMP-binding, CBS, and nucleotidyltransferase domain